MTTDLFYPKELTVIMADGQRADCSIQLRDFSGRPDCKAGHFGYNFWFRPAAAIKKTFAGYSSPRRLELAVEKTARRLGLQVIGWGAAT